MPLEVVAASCCDGACIQINYVYDSNEKQSFKSVVSEHTSNTHVGVMSEEVNNPGILVRLGRISMCLILTSTTEVICWDEPTVKLMCIISYGFKTFLYTEAVTITFLLKCIVLLIKLVK